MQADRGIYHKRVCDRCGAVLGGRMMNPDEYFKDWGWRRDTGDLCPECYAEYKRVIGRFNRGTRFCFDDNDWLCARFSDLFGRKIYSS